MTENEMVGQHHRLNGHEFKQGLGIGDGHEFKQALGIGDGQGSLAWSSLQDRKESDMTE